MIARLKSAGARTLSLLLIPASIVPVLLVVPQIAESHRLFDRRHNSGPIAPPEVVLSANQKARLQPVAPYAGKGSVPVLAYGQVTDSRDAGPLAVTRRAFAEQMAALRQMGFRSIATGDYLRLRRGDTRGLPERPILITFDGGRLNSYRGTDRVLQRYGFQATMFVATADVRREDPKFLTWRELKDMDRSSRWDIQPLAHDGYRRVASNERGDMAPFYAVRRFTASEGLETFADYERRVTEDVFDVREALEDQGFDPQALAVPEGNYGQLGSNDQAIAPFMRGLLARQFGAFFTRDAKNDPGYAGADAEAERYVVGRATTTDRLYMWLRDHSPGAARPDHRPKRRRSHR